MCPNTRAFPLRSANLIYMVLLFATNMENERKRIPNGHHKRPAAHFNPPHQKPSSARQENPQNTAPDACFESPSPRSSPATLPPCTQGQRGERTQNAKPKTCPTFSLSPTVCYAHNARKGPLTPKRPLVVGLELPAHVEHPQERENRRVVPSLARGQGPVPELAEEGRRQALAPGGCFGVCGCGGGWMWVWGTRRA